jgi:hypothetical protein
MEMIEKGEILIRSHRRSLRLFFKNNIILMGSPMLATHVI